VAAGQWSLQYSVHLERAADGCAGAGDCPSRSLLVNSNNKIHPLELRRHCETLESERKKRIKMGFCESLFSMMGLLERRN
jgi:hypothetical protein